MNRLMILVAFLVVALVAAPAIAENGPTDESGDTPAVEDPPSALETPAAIDDPPAFETPVIEDPPPALETPIVEYPPPALETPAAIDDPPAFETPVVEDPPPALETPVVEDPPPAQKEDEDPVSDTSADDTSSVPGDLTSTDTDNDPDVADNKEDGTVEDTAKKSADDVTKDEIVDAADRKDRLADRLLAFLKDSKKDKDDEDDASKDGVEQSQDQDADSGDVDQDADVINTGDNVNQCVGILQVANTGNAQNATGVTQFDSETDEIELEDGSQITLTPQLVVDCRQIILQIVRGERPNDSKITKAKLREAIQPRSGATQAARTGVVPNQVSGVPGQVGARTAVPTGRLGAAAAPKVLSASRAGQPKTASLKSLPRTGGFSGYATLLGLSAGTLLVGGGLLVRRLSR